jgi:hypothetical protein
MDTPDSPAGLRRRFASFKPEGPRLPAAGSVPTAVPSNDAGSAASDSDDGGEDAPRLTAPPADDGDDWLALYVLLGFVLLFCVGVAAPSVFGISGRALSAGGLGAALLGVSLSIFSPGGLSTWMLHAVFIAAGGLGLCVGGLVGNTVTLTL